MYYVIYVKKTLKILQLGVVLSKFYYALMYFSTILAISMKSFWCVLCVYANEPILENRTHLIDNKTLY